MRKNPFLLKNFNILILLFLLFPSCQDDDIEPGNVINISVKTAPLKVDYYVGEALDLSGLKVTLIMNNGDEEDIPFADFTGKGISCSPENGTELTTDLNAITITHSNSSKNTIQSIEVSEITVKEISIKTPPDNTKYFIGESLNLSGLIITLIKNNGDTKDIILSNFESEGLTCFPENGTILTEPIVITITHNESGANKSLIITLKITDIEDNIYKIVKIGDQFWMAENLKTTKYNDGTTITLIENDWNWPTTEGYCWYNNKASYGDLYGALYNWYTIENENLCPNGWHVPNDSDWKILEGFVDSNFGIGDSEWDKTGERGFDVGKKLKSGSAIWNLYGNSISGTNDFEFNALPSGIRASNGDFVEGVASFWSFHSIESWRRVISHHENTMSRYTTSESNGYSVRCIKDSE